MDTVGKQLQSYCSPKTQPLLNLNTSAHKIQNSNWNWHMNTCMHAYTDQNQEQKKKNHLCSNSHYALPTFEGTWFKSFDRLDCGVKNSSSRFCQTHRNKHMHRHAHSGPPCKQTTRQANIALNIWFITAEKHAFRDRSPHKCTTEHSWKPSTWCRNQTWWD